MSGSIGRQSDVNASGSVDSAGHLVIDDATWRITIALGGLGVGKHDSVMVSMLDKGTNEVFTNVGASCSAQLDAHNSTGGSVISGFLTCTALQSTAGEQVSIVGGTFLTYLADNPI
jgi:hypothetical protein